MVFDIFGHHLRAVSKVIPKQYRLSQIITHIAQLDLNLPDPFTNVAQVLTKTSKTQANNM